MKRYYFNKMIRKTTATHSNNLITEKNSKYSLSI